MDGFTFVELAVNLSPLVFAVHAAKGGDGFDDPAIFLEGSGEIVLASGGLEP